MPQIPGLAKAPLARLSDFVVVLLIPVLLAVSGLHTNLREFGLDDLGGLFLFLGTMIVSKWGVSAFTGPAVGLTLRESNAIGMLMNCRGLEILIVGLIGLQAGVLTQQMMAVFVIGAIVTTLMTGPLFDRFSPRTPAAVEPAADAEPAERGRHMDG